MLSKIRHSLYRSGYYNRTSSGDSGATPKLPGFVRFIVKVWDVLCVLRGLYFDKRFDRKHNVDTSGAIYLRELEIDSDNVNQGELYDAFPYGSFLQLVKCLPLDVTEYTFVDFGSGKGRVLLSASDRPFASIIGVEFSKQLHDVAVTNITSYRNARQKCFNLKSTCMDAIDFSIPKGKCILFFFSPFQGHVLEQVICNVKKSYIEDPRHMMILFVTDPGTHPVPMHVVEAQGVFAVVEEGLFPFDFARRYPLSYVILEAE